MQGVFSTPLTKLIELELLRLFLLVHRRAVITPFALGARHSYDISHLHVPPRY